MVILNDGYVDGGEPYTKKEMELINKEEETKLQAHDLFTGENSSTEKYWASCWLSKIGIITQWGSTKEEAVKNLKNFVTKTIKGNWIKEIKYSNNYYIEFYIMCASTFIQ